MGTTNVYYSENDKQFFITNSTTNTVTSFDEKGNELASQQLGNYPMSMVAFKEKLYIINFKDTKLSILNVKNLKVEQEWVIPKSAHGLAIIEETNELWVGGHGDGSKPNSSVKRYALATGELQGEIEMPLMPVGLTKTKDSVLVISHGHNELYVADFNGKVKWQLEVGANPFVVDQFKNYIVVAGYDDHTLYFIKDGHVEKNSGCWKRCISTVSEGGKIVTTVLIVDDERDMRNLIEMMLNNSNFETFTAASGMEAYDIIVREQIDLVLLDVMMPHEDGFVVCQSIRAMSNVPIIFLTARDANEDKVKGLTLGGDDYIVKPFTVEELLARIRAVLRRTGSRITEIQQKYIVIGPIKLDEISRKVSVNDKSIPLTLKEFELLQLFMKNPGNAYTREQLLERIWDIDYIGGTRTVDTHIKTLRLKLGKEAAAYVQTVWGVGYRFDANE